VARTLVLSLLARVPLSAFGLLIVLHVRQLSHSYALAGACSGGCALGMALVAPLIGRAVDRMGQPLVLVATGAGVAVTCAGFAVLPAACPGVVFVLGAAAIGAVQPPAASCARVLWRRLLAREEFNRLVTLDASLQELAFMSGPVVLVGLASGIGAPAALVTSGLLLGACAAVLAVLPETRRLGGPHCVAASHDEPAGSPLVSPGVRLLLVMATCMGVAFGATEISVVRAAEHAGASGAVGLLFAFWGLGSFLSGAVWSRTAEGRHTPTTAMFALLVGAGVASLPLGLATDTPALALGLVLAGAAIAPLFGLFYSAMADVAPSAALTEAFTLETSAITAGIALGSTAAGAIAGGFGAAGSFALAGGAYLVGAAVLRARRRVLAPATLP
jgi:MFS family permease